MSHSALYDDDILLWSEQQAEIIRRLGKTRRDLPNEFDIENVAEEVESVGRSELAAVESYIELIFVHLIKLAMESEADSAPGWLAEIVAFHGNMRRRYAPSMRKRIDVEDLWRLARIQALLTLSAFGSADAYLPKTCPFSLDDLLAKNPDINRFIEILAGKSDVSGLSDLAQRVFGEE